MTPVVVTGATGYLRRAAVAALLAHGHMVHALARRGSALEVPAGAMVVTGNALDADSFAAAILRPWYVLGPGHMWPYALVPVYALLRVIPATRAGAERLGLVTRQQLTAALVRAVETPPPAGIRIVEVSDIRGASDAHRDRPENV